MGLINPLSLLVPPVLLLLSIPLVLFAVATTVLAVSTLLLRVSIIYCELALALLKSYILDDESDADHKGRKVPVPRSPTSPHRRRASSALSSSSSQELLRKQTAKSNSYVSLLGAGAPGRDYEGVGGWRDPVDDQEESLWLGMNKRLELPVPKVERPRRHQRSLTGGSNGASNRSSWGPEAMRMSPLQSRARTPSAADVSRALSVASEEYFGYQPHKQGSTPVETVSKDGFRRKRLSGSGERREKGSSKRKSSVGASSNSSSGSSTRSSKRTSKRTSWF